MLTSDVGLAGARAGAGRARPTRCSCGTMTRARARSLLTDKVWSSIHWSVCVTKLVCRNPRARVQPCVTAQDDRHRTSGVYDATLTFHGAALDAFHSPRFRSCSPARLRRTSLMVPLMRSWSKSKPPPWRPTAKSYGVLIPHGLHTESTFPRHLPASTVH